MVRCTSRRSNREGVHRVQPRLPACLLASACVSFFSIFCFRQQHLSPMSVWSVRRAQQLEPRRVFCFSFISTQQHVSMKHAHACLFSFIPHKTQGHLMESWWSPPPTRTEVYAHNCVVTCGTTRRTHVGLLKKVNVDTNKYPQAPLHSTTTTLAKRSRCHERVESSCAAGVASTHTTTTPHRTNTPLHSPP